MVERMVPISAAHRELQRRHPEAGDGVVGPGTISSPLRFLRMMDTFTLLGFVMTFLVGATAGAWVNGLTNSYVLRSGGDPSSANDQ